MPHITRFNHPDPNWLNAVLSLRAEFDEMDSPERFIHFILPRLEDETMLLILAWEDETPVGYGLAFGRHTCLRSGQHRRLVCHRKTGTFPCFTTFAD